MRGVGKNFSSFKMLNEAAITYEMTNIRYYGRDVKVMQADKTWAGTNVKLITNNPNDCIPLREVITLKLKQVEK